MKIHTIINQFYCLLSTFLLLASCSQDDGLTGNRLPEGQYQLKIASVTMSTEVDGQPWGAAAPQTRVAENPEGNGSVWQNGDKIQVRIENGTIGTYTYQDGGMTVSDGDMHSYWKSTVDNQSIRAWNTSSSSETVELDNQTDGLAYVLTAQATADFNTPVSLAFDHALAKVRVVFSEESTADLTGVSVSILAPITCIVEEGNVTPGSTTSYIPMHEATYNGKVCYEANVTPNLTLENDAFQLVVGGKTVNCSITKVTTQARQLHVITLTVMQGKII